MKRLLAIGAFAAAAAFAQTSGTITVTGVIPDQVSITNSTGTAVSATVTLVGLTAANNATLVGGTTGVQLRSNKKYSLTAATAFANTGNGADDGGSPITAADIGFGINLSAPGGDGTNVVTRADVINPYFDYTAVHVNALPVTNGLTPFAVATANKGTLADLPATGAQLLGGNRISKKGNIQTNNNFLDLTFGVATLPQYFTPTSGFSATVTLTIAGV